MFQDNCKNKDDYDKNFEKIDNDKQLYHDCFPFFDIVTKYEKNQSMLLTFPQSEPLPSMRKKDTKSKAKRQNEVDL
jgi:hypothetical protein